MKRVIAVALAVLMCCAALCASADNSQTGILDLPPEMQVFIYACAHNGIPVYGSGFCDIQARKAAEYYEYDYEGLMAIYCRDGETYSFGLVINDEYKPWSYMLAIQYFCGVTFEDAAKAYCDLYMSKAVSGIRTLDLNGMQLELLNYTFRIIGIPHG